MQVAFILAGSTHTTYCKTLQNALGMKTVNANVFYETIGKMYPVVKAMLDDLYEVAKREMNSDFSLTSFLISRGIRDF